MKNTKIVLLVVAILAAVACMCACDFVENATSIEITNMPKTTFVEGETLDKTSFGITITVEGVATLYTLEQAELIGVELTGFSTAELGTFTATVSYQGYSATFNYSVIASESIFSSGAGTSIDPYIVLNEDQFYKIGNYKGSSFRLGADIELTETPASISGYNSFFIDSFSGDLDGNDHTITFETDGIVWIFNLAYNFRIHDIVFDFYGKAPSMIACACGNAILDNVTTTGSVFPEVVNYSPFIRTIGDIYQSNYNKGLVSYKDYYIYARANASYLNCKNYTNICLSATNGYFGVFVGYGISTYDGTHKLGINGQYTDVENSTFKFENCVNYGDLEGNKIAVMFGNGAGVANNKTEMVNFDGAVEIINCANEGNITYIDSANLLFGAAAYNNNAGVTIKVNNSTITADTPLDGTKVQVLDDNCITIENSKIIINDVAVKGKLGEKTYTYKVTAYFESYNDSDINAKVYFPVKTLTESFDTGLFNYKVKAQGTLTGLTAIADSGCISIHNEAYVLMARTNGFNIIKENTKVNVGVYVYDGEILVAYIPYTTGA